MDAEELKSALEGNLEQEDLERVVRDVLGVDPGSLAPPASKLLLVDALVRRCVELDAVEALCDAAVSVRESLGPRVEVVRRFGLARPEPSRGGDVIGPYEVQREVGRGPFGTVYVARRDGAMHRLKLLRPEVTRNGSALHRYFGVTRRVARVDHPGLPGAARVETIDGRVAVSQAWVDGVPLWERLASSGGIEPQDAWPLLRNLLGALAALHERGLAHGRLSTSNVLVRSDHAVLLLDAGTDFLRASVRGVAHGAAGVGGHMAASHSIAPELIRGELPSPRADVYAFGTLLYQTFTARPVFAREAEIDVLVAHLTAEPDPLSFVAPRGWISDELDELALHLLDKDPARRPRNARAVLEIIERIASSSRRPDGAFPDSEFDSLVASLLEDPSDEVAAAVLEAGVDRGADPKRVADAFRIAAEQLHAGEGGAGAAEKKLLSRAAALYESAGEHDEARRAYERLLGEDPTDEPARAALERVHRHRGDLAAVVELLLERAKNGESHGERARAFGKMGEVLDRDLEDREQALISYTQAVCEDPDDPTYPAAVERLAGRDPKAWREVFTSCTQAARGNLPPERRCALLALLGRWYTEQSGRHDLALQCFQAILTTDPANDEALRGIIEIYRRAQQWKELVDALVMRADGAVPPDVARSLRGEAAEVAEHRLDDPERAAMLHEQVLAEDARHEGASEGLARIRQAAGDFRGYAAVLSRRAAVVAGEARWALLCRVAQVEEDVLEDLAAATRTYETVHRENPEYVEALRGLERAHRAAGRFTELLENLRAQMATAVTPKQKISLLERIATLHADEFRDAAGAAAACESILEHDATHQGALDALARHYRTLERWSDLAALYERHAKVRSGEHRVEMLLAAGEVLDRRLGQTDRALDAYERVRAVDADNARALERVAELKARTGGEQSALGAIEALAEKAAAPEAKVEHYLRAARLLEERGDLGGAITRYRRALEAVPRHPKALAGLRAAYVSRGDTEAALDVLERELGAADGDIARGRACAEMAQLYREQLHDAGRAVAAATRALEYDAAQVDALRILAEVEQEGENWAKAAELYGRVVKELDRIEPPRRPAILDGYVDTLARSGEADRALAVARELLEAAPDDRAALRRASELELQHGDPARARKLASEIVERFGDELDPMQLSRALYRLGEARRRSGSAVSAIKPLEEAAELDPAGTQPLRALALAYEAEKAWPKVTSTLERVLARAAGEERVDVLVRLGDVKAGPLADLPGAAKCYLAAHAERPEDRKILLKLMRLYSEGKQWQALLDVILEIAGAVSDAQAKARYLHTAARVALVEMGDRQRAAELFDRTLELDPTSRAAARDAVELRRAMEDHEGVERLLEQQIRVAVDARVPEQALEFLRELADHHLSHLRVGKAIDAYRVARELDPGNAEYDRLLGELYASDPGRYLDEAVSEHERTLASDPFQPAPYKLLRDLYEETGRSDGLWCICQIMVALNRAHPTDEAFFRRHRLPRGVETDASLASDDWAELLMHPDADPHVSELFRLIQPSLLASRAKRHDQLGLTDRQRVDPDQHPHGVVGALASAASVLGVELPALYLDPNHRGGLKLPAASPPCIVFGHAALEPGQPPKAAAYVAAAHLAYSRPGLVPRFLIANPTALKAWLLASFKLIAPRLPIAPTLEGPVTEALGALEKAMVGPARDRLAQPVSRLLEEGARLDLHRWIRGVDLTSDRAGLLVSDDLETTVQIIKQARDTATAVPVAERLRQLVQFAASRSYLELRSRLRIGIEHRARRTEPPPKPKRARATSP